ncbi:MAG: hypothetical protein ABW036_11975 [Flavitalea sp.]
MKATLKSYKYITLSAMLVAATGAQAQQNAANAVAYNYETNFKTTRVVTVGNDVNISISGNDNDAMIEKKKTFSKTYTIGKTDLVTLDNRFGELKINSWDKAELKVEITMSAKGGTDARASEILDRLSIDESKSSGGYSFRTEINSKNDRRGNNTYKDEGFSINYEVWMPSTARLDAYNEFGATFIGDFSGVTNIVTKFGALTAGKLTNNKKVHVEFGSATIEAINNGNVEIKFSKAIINNLDGTVKAEFEHCGGIQLNLNNNLKSLTVKNNFTQLNLNVNKELSAKYNIYTNFGEFRNKTSFDVANYDEDDENHGPKFDKTYVGKSGNGTIDVKVKSEFSTITLGHELKMDLKEEKKEKKGKGSVNI